MNQPPRVVVLSHDGGGNALGRAIVLADLLEPWANVRIVAFGERLWRRSKGKVALSFCHRPASQQACPPPPDD